MIKSVILFLIVTSMLTNSCNINSVRLDTAEDMTVKYEHETIVDIKLGYNHTAVLTSDGKVYTWGGNKYYQLGDCTANDSYSPMEITSQFNLSEGEYITDLDLGSFNNMALSSDGRVFMWGYNENQELGIGWAPNQSEPIDITRKLNLHENETAAMISLCSHSASALTSQGRVITWGNNRNGQLGNGYTDQTNGPSDITEKFDLNTDERIFYVTFSTMHSAAISSQGRVFTWGDNSTGQLGDGTNQSANVPIEITGNFNLSTDEVIADIILGAFHSAAVSSNGRIFMWGSIDGKSSENTLPYDVTDDFNLNPDEEVQNLFLGSGRTAILTTEGRLLIWGSNFHGELGDGTDISRPEPTDITAQFNLTDGEKITYVSFGVINSSAVTSKNRVFIWGYNKDGQLGIGTADSLVHAPAEVILGE